MTAPVDTIDTSDCWLGHLQYERRGQRQRQQSNLSTTNNLRSGPRCLRTCWPIPVPFDSGGEELEGWAFDQRDRLPREPKQHVVRDKLHCVGEVGEGFTISTLTSTSSVSRKTFTESFTNTVASPSSVLKHRHYMRGAGNLDHNAVVVIARRISCAPPRARQMHNTICNEAGNQDRTAADNDVTYSLKHSGWVGIGRNSTAGAVGELPSPCNGRTLRHGRVK